MKKCTIYWKILQYLNDHTVMDLNPAVISHVTLAQRPVGKNICQLHLFQAMNIYCCSISTNKNNLKRLKLA